MRLACLGSAFAFVLAGTIHATPLQEPPEAPRPISTLATNAFAPTNGFFLLAVPEGLDLDTEVRFPDSFLPSQYAWLYNTIPTAPHSAAELGIGAVSITPGHPWRRRYRPQPLPRRNLAALRAAASVPGTLICDLAIHPKSHAFFSNIPDIYPESDCWPIPENDFVRFSVVTQKGRDFWQQIWSVDLDDFTNRLHATPHAIRIFANANPHDVSTWARSDIARRLRERQTNLKTLNQTYRIQPPLNSLSVITRLRNRKHENLVAHVLYAMEEENSFAELIRTAAEQFAPFPVYYQPQSECLAGIDPATAAKPCLLLAAPAATDRPLLTARYLKTIAKGRPILSPHISPASPNFSSDALTQLARGYSIASIAPSRSETKNWVRYQRNPETGRLEIDVDQTRTVAALRPADPNDVFNPFILDPETLFQRFSSARESVEKAKRYFTPGKPYTETNCLYILHSRTSDRLRACIDQKESDPSGPRPIDAPDLEAFVSTAVYGFYPTGILLEDEICENGALPTSCKVLLVPGCVNACRTETYPILEKWVEAGGTLIINPASLSQTAVATPQASNPNSDFPTATIRPGVQIKPLKNGKILRFTPTQSLDQILLPILEDCGIQPILRVTNTSQESDTPILLEAVRTPAGDGLHWAYLLFNRADSKLDAAVSLPSSPNSASVSISLAPNEGTLLLLPTD